MVPEHFSYTYDRKILLQTSKRTFFACFLNRKFCVFNRKCHVFNRKFCVPSRIFYTLFFLITNFMFLIVNFMFLRANFKFFIVNQVQLMQNTARCAFCISFIFVQLPFVSAN